MTERQRERERERTGSNLIVKTRERTPAENGRWRTRASGTRSRSLSPCRSCSENNVRLAWSSSTEGVKWIVQATIRSLQRNLFIYLSNVHSFDPFLRKKGIHQLIFVYASFVSSLSVLFLLLFFLFLRRRVWFKLRESARERERERDGEREREREREMEREREREREKEREREREIIGVQRDNKKSVKREGRSARSGYTTSRIRRYTAWIKVDESVRLAVRIGESCQIDREV